MAGTTNRMVCFSFVFLTLLTNYLQIGYAYRMGTTNDDTRGYERPPRQRQLGEQEPPGTMNGHHDHHTEDDEWP
jgi:hypothetical protein